MSTDEQPFASVAGDGTAKVFDTTVVLSAHSQGHTPLLTWSTRSNSVLWSSYNVGCAIPGCPRSVRHPRFIFSSCICQRSLGTREPPDYVVLAAVRSHQQQAFFLFSRFSLTFLFSLFHLLPTSLSYAIDFYKFIPDSPWGSQLSLAGGKPQKI